MRATISSTGFKHRILFESIPSGQNYLAPLIEAMRDGVTVEITYRNFWKEKEATFEVEPYCVKVFRQRWYLVARNIGFDALRIYSLDRILGLRQTDNRFSYPQDFDPEFLQQFRHNRRRRLSCPDSTDQGIRDKSQIHQEPSAAPFPE